MSNTGPKEGTLLVNPMLKHASAYIQLRPFFKPSALDPSNLDAWELDSEYIPEFPGSVPGTAQELNVVTHPHLELADTMVSMPRVTPGDFVVWSCDTIHAVDAVHVGKGDSSVLYIPAAPLCEINAKYLASQKEAFLERTPPPDFPGGNGERGFVGTGETKDIVSQEGLTAFGLGEKPWEIPAGASEGEAQVIKQGNQILGWA